MNDEDSDSSVSSTPPRRQSAHAKKPKVTYFQDELDKLPLSAELDEFYGRFDWSKRKSLWRFIKKVLVLCHGSAALES